MPPGLELKPRGLAIYGEKPSLATECSRPLRLRRLYKTKEWPWIRRWGWGAHRRELQSLRQPAGGEESCPKAAPGVEGTSRTTTVSSLDNTKNHRLPHAESLMVCLQNGSPPPSVLCSQGSVGSTRQLLHHFCREAKRFQVTSQEHRAPWDRTCTGHGASSFLGQCRRLQRASSHKTNTTRKDNSTETRNTNITK